MRLSSLFAVLLSCVCFRCTKRSSSSETLPHTPKIAPIRTFSDVSQPTRLQAIAISIG